MGVKYDKGKPKTALLKDFSNALTEIAKVATFGAEKYSEHGWINVLNARERYEHALWRHLLQDGMDEESNLPHLAHMAWNALAVLELELRQYQHSPHSTESTEYDQYQTEGNLYVSR